MSESFSKQKIMELPRSIAVGHRVLDRLGEICAETGLTGRPLIVEDEITEGVAGRRAGEILKDSGFKAFKFMISEADWGNVEKAVEYAKKRKVSFMLGIGGGRPIDVAKCASSEIGIPFVSVPTAASHDGIISSAASLLVNGKKRSISAHPPVAIVADTEIIASAPYRLMTAGYGDIISNKSAVLDWELANREKGEEISSYASTLSMITAETMLRNVDKIKERSEESAWLIVKALSASGVAMSIAGSSRPASGAEHLFSHALDRIAKKPGLHGHQCALGSIITLKLHGADWEDFRDRMRIAGLPTTAKEMGISEKEVVDAILMAPEIRPERYTIFHKLGMNRGKAENIARETGVIGG